MWSSECLRLKFIDNLLTCGICYEYMDTSVMTLCSHNYCSLCIRKYLHYKTQCPICFEETFEKDLRKNKVLDEIIVHYLNVKENFEQKNLDETEVEKNENLGVVHSLNGSRCKEKVDSAETSEMSPELDNQALITDVSIPHVSTSYQQDVASSSSPSTSSKIPLIFTPKRKKGFRNEKNYKIVACPVCGVQVPQDNINKHLDNCLKRENTKDQVKKNVTEETRKPLPKLVCSLMKDNMIRKKLKELGLSTQGDRKTLENRLHRYTILYNAECDKTNPRPVSKLIKQCEEEESLEKKVQNTSNRLNVNRNTEHNIIEEQKKKYLIANKDSFKQLIAKIKYADNPRKIPIKRDILDKENFDVPCKNRIVENDSRDIEKSYISPVYSSDSYDDDSYSNASCSRVNPMNLLAIEIVPSDDETDQCLPIVPFEQNTSNVSHKNNSVKLNSIAKVKNIKTELPSFESTSIYEKFIKTKNSERAKLSPKRSRMHQEKHVGYFQCKNSWEMKLCDRTMDSIADMESDVIGVDCANDGFVNEGPKHEQFFNAERKYASDHIKFEEENVELEMKSINVLQKRERETPLNDMLSDDEKISDKSTNSRKSAKFGLSEAKEFIEFNNFHQNVPLNEEESQIKKEQLHIIRAKNRNSVLRKSIKLKNKS